jgi:hypothetical protein
MYCSSVVLVPSPYVVPAVLAVVLPASAFKLSFQVLKVLLGGMPAGRTVLLLPLLSMLLLLVLVVLVIEDWAS